MEAKEFNSLFDRVVADYHSADNVDAECRNPYTPGTLEFLLYRKCWIDSVQWHLEDIIRDPEIDPVQALAIKRRIDRSNQDRTDVVEYIDSWYLDKFKDVVPAADAGAFALGYGKHLRRAAAALHGLTRYFELGNEDNGHTKFIYTEICRHAAAGIRSAQPFAVLSNSGTAYVDYAWLEFQLKRGLGDVLDAFIDSVILRMQDSAKTQYNDHLSMILHHKGIVEGDMILARGHLINLKQDLGDLERTLNIYRSKN